MLSFHEVGKILDAIADELPREFFKDLNGGILLMPKACRDHGNSVRGLYTLGEYVHDEMGRYIIIYYGSFVAVYKDLPPDELRKELRETLIHEFTHHLESLSGDCSLDMEDEQEMVRFRAPRGNRRLRRK
ncbi:MAG: metallopeptidase family protein [Synergistaceae bacterium]|nr:metallopeptidase family protein [Synergistaceae bacterium]